MFLGIYDVVGNLGSLAARLVFSKIEESAYFYFTQTVSREKNTKNLVRQISFKLMSPFYRLLSYFIVSFMETVNHISFNVEIVSIRINNLVSSIFWL